MRKHTTAPVLEITALHKSYGEHHAVRDLSLSVEKGEIFGILGSNGAGKTTSVEIAQGIRRADSGLVRVLGHDPIADRTRLRGRVGSQLQDSNLPDGMRVIEAIRLFADGKKQVDAALNDWELSDLAKVPFGKLSGGQRQRLFLALALLNNPEVVFLDELTQGLDPNARRSVWELIERVREGGTTVVLVTHFMEEAEVLCDRVVVMTNGVVLDRGMPSELIERHGSGTRMRFGSDSQDLTWLHAVPEVTSVTRIGSEVEVAGSGPMVAYVGAALVARGQVPDSVRVSQPNLEDALLTLINPNTLDLNQIETNGVSA
jgi:ABC-2 type transport system ATP-binding protein